MTRSDWPKPRTYYSSARGNSPPPSSPSILPIAVAVALTTLAILFWRVSGTRAGTQGTLIDMGFDPGRAELLGALLIGSVVAAIVGLALDKPGAAIFLGTWTALLDDVGAFRHDTTRALATGAHGSFDLIGWLLTGLAIVAAALVVARATATLARPVRSSLLRSWSAILALRRGRPL